MAWLQNPSLTLTIYNLFSNDFLEGETARTWRCGHPWRGREHDRQPLRRRRQLAAGGEQQLQARPQELKRPRRRGHPSGISASSGSSNWRIQGRAQDETGKKKNHKIFFNHYNSLDLEDRWFSKKCWEFSSLTAGLFLCIVICESLQYSEHQHFKLDLNCFLQKNTDLYNA